jgi:hypothetical protein
MTDDITHNLTVVREALEAEGLSVHLKLIDAAIEEIAKMVDRKEFEIVRTASRLFEDACNRWMDRALKAEAHLASAKKVLTEIAALAHRWKWQFDLSEDQNPSGAQARNLITQGFDSLHRLGDQALKSRDSLSSAYRKDEP